MAMEHAKFLKLKCNFIYIYIYIYIYKMDFPKSTIITQELIDAALEQLNNEEEQNGLAIIAIQQRLIDALKK